MESKKQKDPAFLFYSKDFYEGTRTMLPKERACYIDLMIYQHQNEYIPQDIERILLYCNGIDEATLIAVLASKFKLCNNGYYNEKLQTIVLERKEFSSKQSINGIVGQFFKKAKTILEKKQYYKLRELYENQSNEDIFNEVKDIIKDEAMLKAMLKAKLKHLEDEDVSVIIDINTIEEIYKTYPSNCIVKKERSLGKCAKNKEQIKTLLKKNTKDEIIKIIEAYKTNCVISGTYMKNFGTFLNQMPDYSEVQPKTPKFIQTITDEDKKY